MKDENCYKCTYFSKEMDDCGIPIGLRKLEHCENGRIIFDAKNTTVEAFSCETCGNKIYERCDTSQFSCFWFGGWISKAMYEEQSFDKKDEEDRIILISSSSNKNPDKIEEDDNE